MLRLRLKQLMARPGDVSGTMLRSAGLATAMLPVAASQWPLMSPLTNLLSPPMVMRLLSRPKSDVVRVGRRVPPVRLPSSLPRHALPPTTHEPGATCFRFLRLAERTADRLSAVHDQESARGRMRGARTGGAYDWDLDYPSPLMPRVYVLLSGTGGR